MVRGGDLGDKAVDGSNFNASHPPTCARGEHIAGRMRVREDEQASMTEVKTVVERIPGALIGLAAAGWRLNDYETGS